MKKIHVDSTMGVHLNNGIVHIILGSDDLSQKFYKENEKNKSNIKSSGIISMPIHGFIKTLSIFQNFADEPHIKMILDSYADVGILKKDK